MKYLFILGRNIELSVEEVKSFLRRKNLEFKQAGLINNGMLVEVDKKLPDSSIEQLGGVVSIGEVLAEGKPKEIFNEIDKKTIYFTEGNKMNYVVFNFNNYDATDILFYLKKRFRKEGLKAIEKKLTGNIKLQSGEFVPNVASKNIDEQYFVFEDNFGRITETSNYEKIEERDMKKPVRRSELSISPRLAKILVNLSEVREGEILLDPFCGIGIIMQEALLQNINVIGIDKDRNAIEGAQLNLKWFGFNKGNYKLINEDSSKTKIRKAEGIATEPELGELQRSAPSAEKARGIIRDFEELMIRVLRNLKDSVNGKIVFTAPLILTGRSRIACDFEKISSRAGLRLVQVIPEFRENIIVGRSVVVMEK